MWGKWRRYSRHSSGDISEGRLRDMLAVNSCAFLAGFYGGLMPHYSQTGDHNMWSIAESCLSKNLLESILAGGKGDVHWSRRSKNISRGIWKTVSCRRLPRLSRFPWWGQGKGNEWHRLSYAGESCLLWPLIQFAYGRHMARNFPKWQVAEHAGDAKLHM